MHLAATEALCRVFSESAPLHAPEDEEDEEGAWPVPANFRPGVLFYSIEAACQQSAGTTQANPAKYKSPRAIQAAVSERHMLALPAARMQGGQEGA